MSKLIYSPTSTLIEGTYNKIKNTDQAVNPVYYSVAFTGDGYIYTHGKKFRLFNVVNDAVEGLLFQIQDGTAGFYIDGASIGTGTVVQSVTGDSVVTATTTDGAVTIAHAEFLQQGAQYGSATQVPIITVNATGHITAIQNSATIDISKVRGETTSEAGQYYILGVTGDTLQHPLYNANLYFDANGNIHASNMYIGNNALSTLFAAIGHTSVYATDSTYGHVTLTDTPSNDYDADDHIAATPKAVMAGVTTANQYAQNLFAAQDAMIFVGTIESDGTITSHNSAVLPTAVDDSTNINDVEYKVGWTFRFVENGTFNGEDVETGDMIIAVKDKATLFDMDDWTVIQTNISGALTSASNLNGLLYSNNSRVVNSLALASGILKYDGTTLSFVNPNTVWRDIQIDSTSIGTNTLNLIAGNAIGLTESNGSVTISVNSSNIIQSAAALSITQGQVTFQYKPTAAASLTIGDKLTLEQDQSDNYILKHATGTVFTNKLGSITTDSYGHVTAISEVTSLPNPNALTIKTNSTTALEYTGSEAKVLIFKNGGDISFTSSTDADQNKVIEAAVTHKYREIKFQNSADNPTQLLGDNSNIALTLLAGTNVAISNVGANNQNLPAGTLMISAEDTWRNIQAYKFQSNILSRSSIGDGTLNFSNDFIFSDNEIAIMWTEIDENGVITYVK